MLVTAAQPARLALEAAVSARHVSFAETGRWRPSAEMILHLCEQLEVPFRERNRLLLSAGYAPAFAEHPLDAPQMGPPPPSTRSPSRSGSRPKVEFSR